nr:MAG TPA: hypothetical protein [Caudoviricetes sp.]
MWLPYRAVRGRIVRWCRTSRPGTAPAAWAGAAAPCAVG